MFETLTIAASLCGALKSVNKNVRKLTYFLHHLDRAKKAEDVERLSNLFILQAITVALDVAHVSALYREIEALQNEPKTTTVKDPSRLIELT